MTTKPTREHLIEKTNRQRTREAKAATMPRLVSRQQEEWKAGGMEPCLRLEWNWHSGSCLFYDGQDLFQFSEVLQHGNASLGYGVDYSTLAHISFFDKALFDQEVEVFFQYATVDVGLVHDVREFEWAAVS